MAKKKAAAKPKPEAKPKARKPSAKPAAAKAAVPAYEFEEGVSLERLHPDPANARLHNEANIASIMGSLRTYDQVEPLVVQRSSGRIIGGNGRYEAMRLLGWSRCRVAWVECDDTFATGLGITLNRTGEKAEWDYDTLGKLLEQQQAQGIDLQDIGWSPEELAPIFDADFGQLPGEGGGEPADEPDMPEVPAKAVSKLGDVWALGQHRLMCGDSTDAAAVARLMDGRLADLIFTDPPYNIAGYKKPAAWDLRDSYKNLGDSEWDKNFKFEDVAPNMLSVLSDNGSVYVSTSGHLVGSIMSWMREWSQHYSYCVWAKSNPMPSLNKRHWTWCTELICYATRGKHTFNFPQEGHALNVWNIEKNRSNDMHPTMKPVAVPLHAITHSSSPGDLVVDLFGGAGSTLLACEQSQRVCRMMEREPRYVDVIVKRWEEMTGAKAVRQPAKGAEAGQGAAADLAR